MSQGKKHVPTDQTRLVVENASGYGMRHEQIAALIGVTDKTLRRRYRKELDQGMAKAHFNVSKNTYEQAISGKNPTMTIWYEKTRMGMRETMQVTTPPDEPFETKGHEAELIGAYYRRLAAAGINPEEAAAGGSPARADTGADPGVDPPGQEPQGSEGRPPARKG